MHQNRVMSYGGDVRCIGEWRFEGGGFVSILVGGEVPTATAIEWIERLLEVKKTELANLNSGPCFKATDPSGQSDPAVTPDCHGPETGQS
jgi:hypothetical protein